MMIKLFTASLEVFENNGSLIYVARFVGKRADETNQTPDKIAALQWLGERAFPSTGDFRVSR